jgi:hypothetical protein
MAPLQFERDFATISSRPVLDHTLQSEDQRFASGERIFVDIPP